MHMGLQLMQIPLTAEEAGLPSCWSYQGLMDSKPVRDVSAVWDLNPIAVVHAVERFPVATIHLILRILFWPFDIESAPLINDRTGLVRPC